MVQISASELLEKVENTQKSDLRMYYWKNQIDELEGKGRGRNDKLIT